jgi:hypothetical protein
VFILTCSDSCCSLSETLFTVNEIRKKSIHAYCIIMNV